jgi:hypothetical protein
MGLQAPRRKKQGQSLKKEKQKGLPDTSDILPVDRNGVGRLTGVTEVPSDTVACSYNI